MNLSAERPPFVPGPIAMGRDVPLSASSGGQPVISEALLDNFRPMTIGVVTAAIQGSDVPQLDGTAKETVREVKTSGCTQPVGESLAVQAEGERSWEKILLHTTPDFNVGTDAIVVISGTRYRIVDKRDWSVNGYVRYELHQDYARAR